MKIKVYIASPYTIGDKVENVKRQIDAAETLLNNGFAPYVPLLNHYWELDYKHTDSEWLDLDFEYLAVCDVVLRLSGDSVGADKECELARQLGKLIYYDIEDLIYS